MPELMEEKVESPLAKMEIRIAKKTNPFIIVQGVKGIINSSLCGWYPASISFFSIKEAAFSSPGLPTKRGKDKDLAIFIASSALKSTSLFPFKKNLII